MLFVLSLIVWGTCRTAVVGRLMRMRRRVFWEKSRKALARAARTGRYSAVLMIDLNGSDPAGAVAEMLRRAVTSPGRPARLGAARFAMVLPGLGSPEQAYEVAGRFAASVAPVIVNGRLVTIAASIGVAVSGPGELTHGELVHRAVVAMRKAGEFAPETRWAAWRESYEKEQRPARLAEAA